MGLMAFCLCASVRAQDTAQHGVESQPIEPQTVEPEPDDPKLSPCFPDGRETEDEETKWIDRLPGRLYAITCSPVSWFDGLFGPNRFENEYQNTHGHVTLGTLWDERGNFQRVTRAKVRVYLPQLSERFNAFVGRLDEDNFVREDQRSSETTALPTPEPFSRNLDDATLLGLGYNEPLKKNGSFDGDVGVRVRFPLDPYVKGSYRIARPVGEKNLMRLRETVFWQSSEGFGTTTRLDWDRVLADDFFTRWTGSGTFSQNTIGMRWYSTLTLYQMLRHKRALAYEIKSYGSTDNDVPLNNYGFTAIYRRSAWREWLWLELRAGIDWPRDTLDQVRQSNLNAGLIFEVRYSKPN